jgi:nitrile hydratase
MTESPGTKELARLPREEGGPVFVEPWAARAIAIVVKMFGRRRSWPEWVDYFSAEIAAPGHYRRPESNAGMAGEKLTGDANRINTHYFEYWLAACEKLLVAKGVITKGELDEKASELAAAQSPAPSFARGERIVVRDIDPVGHAHLPLYVRGKTGVVERNLGTFGSTDAGESGAGESRQCVYSVRFTARELWGPDASDRDSLFFSIWESHLEPA